MPVDRQLVSRGVTQEWSRSAIRSGERCECFPTLGTSHTEVDGIIGIGGEVDRDPVTQVNIQRATCRAKAADGSHDRVGHALSRNAAEPELRWFEHQVARERTIHLAEV